MTLKSVTSITKVDIDKQKQGFNKKVDFNKTEIHSKYNINYLALNIIKCRSIVGVPLL